MRFWTGNPEHWSIKDLRAYLATPAGRFDSTVREVLFRKLHPEIKKPTPTDWETMELHE